MDGGADIIDVKEPDLGPLGRASAATWKAIRASLPTATPLSVALGELAELDMASIHADDFACIAFQKVGLARSTPDWPDRWERVCRLSGRRTGWVAVIYSDWIEAGAPDPDPVVDVALNASFCAGILVDSWNKGRPCSMVADEAWQERISRVQASGRFVALAGRLDCAAIRRLAPLHPDLFAVRGAACAGGDRRTGSVDAYRVARLLEAVRDQPRFLDPA